MSSHAPTDASDSDEILQVVDKEDRPAGSARRDKVHAEKLLHRAVHVLLFNRTGDLYLQRRSAQKDSWPGYWDSSCSGHVLLGESYDEAAARELREELRLQALPRRIGIIGASPATDNEFVYVFTVNHNGPIRPNEAEIDEARFFALDQVRAELSSNVRPLTRVFREVFRLWASTSETLY